MPGDGVQVILVEDDRAVREANVQAFELEGFVAKAFADAESALGEIGGRFQGVLVTDIRLPGMLTAVIARPPRASSAGCASDRRTPRGGCSSSSTSSTTTSLSTARSSMTAPRFAGPGKSRRAARIGRASQSC